MYRRTYAFTIVLAIIATLIAIVNITGVIRNKPVTRDTTISTTSATITPTTDAPSTKIYTNKTCLFSLLYPDIYTLHEDASGTASLVQGNSDDAIVMTCQKDIPRPPLPPTSIETKRIPSTANTATISAKLFHDKSAEDGKPIDALIFYNPSIDKDVFIAGYGDTFMQILATLSVQ